MKLSFFKLFFKSRKPQVALPKPVPASCPELDKEFIDYVVQRFRRQALATAQENGQYGA